MQSLARNHSLVDGNKRTAWAAAWTFLTINGTELSTSFDIDAAELLVLDVATGTEDSVEAIAATLRGFAAQLNP
jgi:death-on-curing protein